MTSSLYTASTVTSSKGISLFVLDIERTSVLHGIGLASNKDKRGYDITAQEVTVLPAQGMLLTTQNTTGLESLILFKNVGGVVL